jgi:transposase
MSHLFWLTGKQMRRIGPYYPLSFGIPRVDDKRVLSGIIFVIRNGLRWRDAPKDYGPHKTICNRLIRCSRLGVFNRILYRHRRNRHPLAMTHGVLSPGLPFSSSSSGQARG